MIYLSNNKKQDNEVDNNLQLELLQRFFYFRTTYSEKYVQDRSIHSHMFFGIYNRTSEYVFTTDVP